MRRLFPVISPYTKFNHNSHELAEAQRQLTEAQRRTEQRLNELVEAQRRTEQRVRELAEAQKGSEERLTRLEKSVAELTEAQKQTEQRLNELAEAQKQTEQRLNELAEAQKRTEEELRKLAIDQKRTREELGGLTHTVGYVLEDRAYMGLPRLLRKDFGVKVEGLKRDFGPGKWEEINLVGKGLKDHRSIWILGECKAQLKKRDVDQFLKKLSRMEEAFPGEKILVAVTYQTSPQVQEYAKSKGIHLYFSYQLGVI